MDNLRPKITVVIVTYNRPLFIKEAIQSVLNQTFTDFELIVVDNGVKIPAKEIVGSFDDSRIKYIQNDKNTDCAGGKNIGMKNMRGEFAAFLDDDDMWLPEKLELQMRAFENNPEAGFCFTAVTQVFEHGTRDSVIPNGVGDYYERALAKFSGFLAVTLMVRKKIIEDIGYMDETFPSHTDIEWVIRIAKKYKGIGINKPLVRVMSLDHNQMGRDLNRRIKGRNMILEKYQDAFEKRPKILAKHLLLLGKYYRNDGQYKQAKEIFKKVYKINFKIKVFAHYLSMFFSGLGYKLFRALKGKKYPKTKLI